MMPTEQVMDSITSEMQSIGRAKHTVLMVTGSDPGPWPLTILQIVFIGIK